MHHPGWRLRSPGMLVLSIWLLLGAMASQACAQEQDFAVWLQGLREEARANGISEKTLAVTLAKLKPLARVLELDRRQPESTLTYTQYIDRVISDARAVRGRALYQEHFSLLQAIRAQYDVAPGIIVALWGIETDFGRATGDFSVISALATLAYDGRRSTFFRQELLQALQIIEAGHIQPQAMRGSWAGAMGQNQFMPSSFVRFAVDYNGDGRRDIWGTLSDVLASIANYLAGSGWRGTEPWGQAVVLPPGFDATPYQGQTRQSFTAWQALGLRPIPGIPAQQSDLQASLVLPGGADGPAFLVCNNYHVLLKWNRSTYFALAAGQLADRIEMP
jgi:membrane-bound lytic murein transglycosylase B